MSDHIPFEIQVEIMKSLPIKSLIQFRSVSKPWKSVIDSSDFIADYTVRSHHAQPKHLLIRYDSLSSSSVEQYVSIVDYSDYYCYSDDDDDSFPLKKFYLTIPRSVKLLRESFVIGTSHGLVCLFGYYLNPGDFKFYSGTATVVVWNPSIRKSVAIAVPDVVGWYGGTAFGFGVCPTTSDPIIVKITDTSTDRNIKSVTCSSSSPWQVEIYSLMSGVWRSLSNNLSDKLLEFQWPHCQINIDGFMYWLGSKNTTNDTRFHLVISFDISCEEFGEIYLPDVLAFHELDELYLFKRRDSLVVLQEWIMDGIYELWMMENGDSKAFTKIFNIKTNPYLSSLPLEFRRNGELVMRTIDGSEDFEELAVYEPFSDNINNLGIKGQCYSLRVSSYTESLILLDQSDTLDDDEDEEDMSV